MQIKRFIYFVSATFIIFFVSCEQPVRQTGNTRKSNKDSLDKFKNDNAALKAVTILEIFQRSGIE